MDGWRERLTEVWPCVQDVMCMRCIPGELGKRESERESVCRQTGRAARLNRPVETEERMGSKHSFALAFPPGWAEADSPSL
mmetsp:Transcript_47696/g.119296  ORF Transcript_47696/g.119296 Transcript_47696/m.119296 type:complete len:81 (+) Transcript_47696:118-360(+)